MAKRIFDLTLSTIGLIIFLPLFIIIAAAIKLDSNGPVYFRQERVGKGGRLFRIHKFRTMWAAEGGSQLTVANDCRITRVGSFLRKYKLDEIPQLMDVLKGAMSLVGPRPEVPKYVAVYPEYSRRVILSVRPGITDPASIRFRNENELLNRFVDPEQQYINAILPMKLSYYEHYVASQSLSKDVVLILQTIKTVFAPEH